MFLLSKEHFQVKRSASKGQGVFARKSIRGGTIIGDYLGTVIKTADYDISQDALGLYLMYYTDQASIFPDLKSEDLHLINHSCHPNCWIYSYKGHTLFFALRTIVPEEEITISYLLSPRDETCDRCTHFCHCGEKKCSGTMHLTAEKYTLWREFQKSQKKLTRTSKFDFGKPLAPLGVYPKHISIHSIYARISI